MVDLLTTVQVAKLLGISVATVNRRASAGELPTAIKAPGIRGAHLFDRATIETLAMAERAA